MTGRWVDPVVDFSADRLGSAGLDYQEARGLLEEAGTGPRLLATLDRAVAGISDQVAALLEECERSRQREARDHFDHEQDSYDNGHDEGMFAGRVELKSEIRRAFAECENLGAAKLIAAIRALL